MARTAFTPPASRVFKLFRSTERMSLTTNTSLVPYAEPNTLSPLPLVQPKSPLPRPPATPVPIAPAQIAPAAAATLLPPLLFPISAHFDLEASTERHTAEPTRRQMFPLAEHFDVISSYQRYLAQAANPLPEDIQTHYLSVVYRLMINAANAANN